MSVNEAIDEGLKFRIGLNALYTSTTQRAVLKARYTSPARKEIPVTNYFQARKGIQCYNVY